MGKNAKEAARLNWPSMLRKSRLVIFRNRMGEIDRQTIE